MGFGFLALLIGLVWRDLRFVRRSYDVANANGKCDDDAERPAVLRQAAELLDVLLVALLTFALFGAIEKEKYLWIVLAAGVVLARIRHEELAAPPSVSSATRAVAG
jgi:hypothetical protein